MWECCRIGSGANHRERRKVVRFEVIDEGCVDNGRSNRSGCGVAEIQSPYHRSSVTACAMKLEKNGTKIEELCKVLLF